MNERETLYELPIECISLGELIEYLKNLPSVSQFSIGFHNPHSYRGMYECLAFEPTENISALEMLATAESCVDKTFEGYKGGDFKMTEGTDVYLAYEGHGWSTPLSILLLDYMREQ